MFSEEGTSELVITDFCEVSKVNLEIFSYQIPLPVWRHRTLGRFFYLSSVLSAISSYFGSSLPLSSCWFSVLMSLSLLGMHKGFLFLTWQTGSIFLLFISKQLYMA